MKCISKLPNLYTIIIVTKIKVSWTKKKELKVSLFLWLCSHCSKLNLTTVRKSPANEVVVGLLSFLIAWILGTVNMVLLITDNSFTKCSIKKEIKFNSYLRRGRGLKIHLFICWIGPMVIDTIKMIP